MKKLYFLAVVLFLGWGSVAGAQSFGFLKTNIWFSKDNFFAGDEVRIYTAIFNGAEMDVDGVIGFFDGENKIGEANFSLARGGRVQDVWVDWVASSGEHLILAEITSAVGSDGGADIVLDTQQSGQIGLDVDMDTDGDRIGDRVDTDDDGDGLSDADEVLLGTDPLLSDTDKDGLPDKEDPSPLIFNVNDTEEEPSLVKDGSFSFSGLATVINSTETGEKAEETAVNAFGAIEVFRIKQMDGLLARKSALEEELNFQKALDSQERKSQAIERNEPANRINEIAENDVFQLTDEESGFPKLSLTRIVKLVYWGFITAMLFVFENKIAFYGVFALIGLKLLFMISRRMFRRRY